MARRKPKQETRGEAVIGWIEDWLKVPEGAFVGQPVKLRQWQRDIICGIYDQPTRQAIVSLGRKNGKTALIAMLVLVHLVGPENRRNAQIYSAAQSRDQAGIVFGLASKMVRMDVELNAAVTVRDSAKELFSHLTGVRYKALSADATTAYGLSPVLVIHDELGQVRGPRSELYDALESAMGAQAGPLSIVISTQSPTDADLLSVLIDDAKAGHDPRTRLFMYAAEPEDDPWVEATWRKANPALGDFRSMDEMRREAEKARRLPAFEASFRNLLLNQRVAVSDHFLTPDVWELNGGAPDPSALDDCDVWGGLDLSGTTDLTALVLVAKGADEILHVFPYFWAPLQGVRERALRDRAPYDQWADEGSLSLTTTGRTVDYAFVARELAELSGKCRLQAVGFDRWRIGDLERELGKVGASIPLVPIGQGFKDMAPAVEKLADVALNGRMRHGMHPVLKWNAANAITRADEAGNLKFDKRRTTGRIDGVVALAMALEVMGRQEQVREPEYQFMVFG